MIFLKETSSVHSFHFTCGWKGLDHFALGLCIFARVHSAAPSGHCFFKCTQSWSAQPRPAAQQNISSISEEKAATPSSRPGNTGSPMREGHCLLPLHAGQNHQYAGLSQTFATPHLLFLTMNRSSSPQFLTLTGLML